MKSEDIPPTWQSRKDYVKELEILYDMAKSEKNLSVAFEILNKIVEMK